MIALTTEQLDQFSREQSLELIKQLLPLVAEVGRLRQRVAELEAKNRRFKNRSANSSNLSQQPSRDQKISQPPMRRGATQSPSQGLLTNTTTRH